jgi:hypothetical protein
LREVVSKVAEFRYEGDDEREDGAEVLDPEESGGGVSKAKSRSKTLLKSSWPGGDEKLLKSDMVLGLESTGFEGAVLSILG